VLCSRSGARVGRFSSDPATTLLAATCPDVEPDAPLELLLKEALRYLRQLACAHVGTHADVAALVQAVLALARPGQLEPAEVHEQDNAALAKQALVQLGFPSAATEAALTAARAQVEPDAPLELLIKEAPRHCR
jgi:hypothetical protein